MRDQSAMMTNIVVTIVMAMSVDADTHADGAHMNADDGGVRRAGTQQGERKNRGNEGFHDRPFEGANSALSPNSA